jgi:hypothetical protein
MGRDVIEGSRRPRAPKDMPALEHVMGEARENLALWIKQRIDEVAREKDAHIEALRNGGEHPTPYCQKMVQFYSMMGLEEKYIAKMLMISHQVLVTNYEEDMKLGYAEGIVTMGSTLYKIGSDPTHKDAARVALEWLSRRAPEWKPPTKKLEVENSDKDQGRIIDSSQLTFEQRQQLREMILAQVDKPETGPGDDDGDDDEAEEVTIGTE